MLMISPRSHLDHHLSLNHVRFLLDKLADCESRMVVTLDLPEGLEALPCGVRGPSVGLPAVPEELVEYRVRPGRRQPSRMLRTDGSTVPEAFRDLYERLCAPVSSKKLTVVVGPGSFVPCVLYTAYGGPAAPREPKDPSLRTFQEIRESEAFWANHCLAL